MATKRSRGRPTRYTKALGDDICAQIATGKSLRTICADPKMPEARSVFRWLRLPSMKYFCHQYARACEARADAFAEDILDIADDATNDYMEVFDKEGESIGYKINTEAIQRSKLRSDNRKWLMARMQPKKYGEKLDVTSGDQPLEQPLFIFNMRPADIKKDKPLKK